MAAGLVIFGLFLNIGGPRSSIREKNGKAEKAGGAGLMTAMKMVSEQSRQAGGTCNKKKREKKRERQQQDLKEEA